MKRLAVPLIEVRQEGEAWVLADDTLEVAVIPKGGRLMSVRKGGGENLLWTSAGSKKQGEWNNVGGDKSWVWPQDRWGKVEGLPVWPPAEGMDQARFELSVEGNVVRAVGPAFAMAGGRVRIVREVALLGGGRMRVTNRVEAVEGQVTGEWAAWEIAQMKWPSDTAVAIEGVRGEVASLGQATWVGAEVQEGVLSLPTGEGGAMKAGVEGERIMYRVPGGEVLMRVVGELGGERRAGEKLQVYRSSSSGKGRYLELEVTSPRRVIAVGKAAEVVVEWVVK